MPSPGVVNNPGGVNGTQLFEQESAYGEIKRLKQRTQAAPLPSVPALNTPERSQARAVRQARPGPTAQKAPEQAYAPGDVWGLLAVTPGASPLLQEYALRAQNGAR